MEEIKKNELVGNEVKKNEEVKNKEIKLLKIELENANQEQHRYVQKWTEKAIDKKNHPGMATFFAVLKWGGIAIGATGAILATVGYTTGKLPFQRKKK
jgi:hypothetical protein